MESKKINHNKYTVNELYKTCFRNKNNKIHIADYIRKLKIYPRAIDMKEIKYLSDNDLFKINDADITSFPDKNKSFLCLVLIFAQKNDLEYDIFFTEDQMEPNTDLLHEYDLYYDFNFHEATYAKVTIDGKTTNLNVSESWKPLITDAFFKTYKKVYIESDATCITYKGAILNSMHNKNIYDICENNIFASESDFIYEYKPTSNVSNWLETALPPNSIIISPIN